jgi:hypothetical protein
MFDVMGRLYRRLCVTIVPIALSPRAQSEPSQSLAYDRQLPAFLDFGSAILIRAATPSLPAASIVASGHAMIFLAPKPRVRHVEPAAATWNAQPNWAKLPTVRSSPLVERTLLLSWLH